MKNAIKIRLLILVAGLVLSAGASSQNQRLAIAGGPFPKACQRYIPDSIEEIRCDSSLVLILHALRNKGYVAASVDSLVNVNNHGSVYLHCGQRYQWENIRVHDTMPSLLPAGWVHNLSRKRIPNYKTIVQLREKIITRYENNGYPFVAIKTDSALLTEKCIHPRWSIEPGKEIRFDSVEVTGTRNISSPFLSMYLGLNRNSLYNEKRIREIDVKLKELAFVVSEKPPELFFIDGKARLRLYLKEKKTNQFAGIIGFAPGDNVGNRLTLTGDVSVKIENSFKHGDVFEGAWKKPEPLSQNLYLSGYWPYVFNTPIGVQAYFKLIKKDSSYVNQISNIKLPFFISGSNYLGVFYQQESSELIAISHYRNTTTLPEQSDYQSRTAGISFLFSSLDYKFNPRLGLFIDFTAGYGKKDIGKIPGVSPGVYEKINLNGFRHQSTLNFSYYFPVWQNLISKSQFNGGWLNTKNPLTNELYRIGGFNNLRGFDEESMYAKSFGILTEEIRYLPDKNTGIFVFCDYGGYTDRMNTLSKPHGFGTGIFFQTKAGIFNLTYAFGTINKAPIELRTAKIHFGFINRF